MQRCFSRSIVLTASLGLMLAVVSGTALAQYKLTNLVSNQHGKAKHTYPNLVNAWGLTSPQVAPSS